MRKEPIEIEIENESEQNPFDQIQYDHPLWMFRF